MIAQFLTSSRCAHILRLLDLERDTILNGPLPSLAGMVERREKALGEIIGAGRELSPDFLAALKARAERNSRLLLASLAGVRAAAAEVEKIDKSRGQIGAYTARGTRAPNAPDPATRDLRA